MASQVLTNVKVFLGEYDISGFMNRVNLDYGALALKDTRMGHDTEVNKGGIKAASCDIGGFGDPASAGMEAISFNKIGTSNIALTCSPDGADVGEVAYFFKALKATMALPFGTHGEIAPFSGKATSGGDTNALVRGKVFVSAGSAKTSSGTSSVIQLGAVGATQRVYAALHVIDTVSGSLPTLDVTVKSDDGSGFASPTTRITFTQVTAKTYQFLSAAGAITDTHWRVDYTVGGSSTPTFPFIVVVGIV